MALDLPLQSLKDREETVTEEDFPRDDAQVAPNSYFLRKKFTHYQPMTIFVIYGKPEVFCEVKNILFSLPSQYSHKSSLTVDFAVFCISTETTSTEK